MTPRGDKTNRGTRPFGDKENIPASNMDAASAVVVMAIGMNGDLSIHGEDDQEAELSMYRLVREDCEMDTEHEQVSWLIPAASMLIGHSL